MKYEEAQANLKVSQYRSVFVLHLSGCAAISLRIGECLI